MRKQLNNIFFLVGFITVIIMLLAFDVNLLLLWENIPKTGYWIIVVLGLWLGLYIMNTLAWKTIIEGSGKCTVSFCRLLQLTISGFALNYTTPIGLLGGEAYRIMELSRFIGVQRATSSVVLFATMHIFTHFWFWLTAIAVYAVGAGMGYLPCDFGIILMLAFSVLFCWGGVYLFMRGYKNGMVVKLLCLISRIPGLCSWGKRFIEKHMDDLKNIDNQIKELQSQNKHSFRKSFFLEYVGRIFQSFEIFFMLLLFSISNDGGCVGYMKTFIYSFLILAFTSLFANLLGFMPLQLGGREGGFVLSISRLGIGAGVGMSISLVCRVRELFWATIGLLLMKVGRIGIIADRENVENKKG